MTSAYSSYSGCRQYRENLADAVAEVPGAPRLDRLRHYFNHPGFIEPMVDATLAALAELPEDARHGGHLAFVTHSIPVTMNDSSGPRGAAYVAQHRARGLRDRRAGARGDRAPVPVRPRLLLAVRPAARCPGSSPTSTTTCAACTHKSVPGVVVVPIGFVSDHMEVIYDLDTEAKATAEELGLPFARAATAGVDPRFVAMVRNLLVERGAAERGEAPERATVGSDPSHDVCPVGCCPNPRGRRPALCGED